MDKLSIIPDYNDIEESLRLSREYGAQFEYNDFFIPDVLENQEKCRELLAFYNSLKRTDRSRDTLHGVFFDTAINSVDSEIRRISKLRFRQSMEAAQALGAKAVIFHTNYITNFNSRAYQIQWLEAYDEFLRLLLEEYPGQKIYMENMFDTKPYLLAELAERMKDEPRFGVCLDVAHANIGTVPMEEWFAVLAPYIRHIHVNDNDGIEDSHLPVGAGKIDWGEYNVLIRKHQLSPAVLVENTGWKVQEQSIRYMKEHHIYPWE